MPQAKPRISQSLRRRLYLPAYRTSEASMLAQTHWQTVSRWFHGHRQVFVGAKRARAPLSYLQLVEVAFVASFRAAGVSLQRVRKAQEYLSKVFQVEYPFAQLELKTDGVHVLKELEEREEGQGVRLVVADRAGQEAWPQLIAERIAQFDYAYELALTWHPRGQEVPIVVDPRISFGAPIVEQAGVATWVLRERYQAGESLDELEDDFGVTPTELMAALKFEGVSLAA